MINMEESQIKRCPYCGEDISINAKKCKHCGEWLEEKSQIVNEAIAQTKPKPVEQTQVIVNQIEKKSNGLGIAGFILSLICAVFSWAPGANFVLWFLGFLFSIIGLFKEPKGLAIAGFVISIIDVVLIVALIAVGSSLLRGLF